MLLMSAYGLSSSAPRVRSTLAGWSALFFGGGSMTSSRLRSSSLMVMSDSIMSVFDLSLLSGGDHLLVHRQDCLGVQLTDPRLAEPHEPGDLLELDALEVV